MTTLNVTIDDELLHKVQEIAPDVSLPEIMVNALREYVDRHRQIQIVSLFGTIEYDPAFDYKEQRRIQ